MLMLAWAIMCAERLLLSSSTLSDHALATSGTALLAIAAWVALGRLGPVRRALDGQIAYVACGVAASAAGVALVFSPGGAPSFALFGVMVLCACELTFAGARESALRDSGGLAEIAAGALVVSGALHFAARLAVGAAGSFANVGAYAQASTTLLMLLPAASALAKLAGSRREGGKEARRDGSAALGDPPSRTAFPGAKVLVVLLAFAAIVAIFFTGVVTVPYQVDMLLCSDCFSCGLIAAGVALWLVAHYTSVRPLVAVAVLSVAALGCALGAMLAFAASSSAISVVPLAVVQASCGCLVVALWTAFSYFAASRNQACGLTAAFLAVAVPLRFAGMGVKHLVGLDSHTVVAYVLAGMVVLMGALFIAVFAIVLSSQSALRAAEREKQRATNAIVEAMRHDAGYVTDALQQVHYDILMEYGLTEREAEIAALQLSGNTMEAIGDRTGIAVSTVRFHLKNVYKKVGVKGKQALREKVSEEMEKRGSLSAYP